MDKINFKGLIKTTEDFITKRSPEILTGIGITGMVTTTILAVKVTPKALDLIAKAEDEKFDSGHSECLTKPEIIKACWKCYIPAAITCTASIA